MALKVSIRVPASRSALRAAIKGLVALNRVKLSRDPLPPLWNAGVRYKAEKRGRERWQTAHEIFGQGYGDCEDLAAWRVAELQNAGELARVEILRTGPKRFHAVVERANGAIEDPSKVLR